MPMSSKIQAQRRNKQDDLASLSESDKRRHWSTAPKKIYGHFIISRACCIMHCHMRLV